MSPATARRRGPLASGQRGSAGPPCVSWRASATSPSWLGRDHPVGVEDELLRGAPVEVLVALRGVVQGNDRGVDRLRDLCLLRQDQVHQEAVVTLHGALARGEGV